MSRGTALVTDAGHVTRLTGQAGLPNLEIGDDEGDRVSVSDLLISASDAIYDRLETDGIDPATLTNENRYQRAVAYQFLAMLAALGHFSAGEGERSEEFTDRFQAMVDRFYEQAKPRTTGDSAAKATDGIPAVGGFDACGRAAGVDYWGDFRP